MTAVCGAQDPEPLNGEETDFSANFQQRITLPFEKNWRIGHDELIVHELAPFALKDGEITRKMFLSTDTAKSFYLQLSHFVFSWKGGRLPNHATKYLAAQIICDKPTVLYLWPQTIRIPANQVRKFQWYDKKLNAQRPFVELTNFNTTCDLIFAESRQKPTYGIRFLPEKTELARIGNPQLKSEICYLPQTKSVESIGRFFMNPKILFTTCPIKVDDFETLEEASEGIKAKVRILTGQSPSDQYIAAGNPFAPLDFSRAPNLDAILISYLVFRADFGGNVILQALRYHAARGTLIRIALSDVISLGKDRQMLLDFQAEFPNVKLLFYKYKPQEKNLKEWIASLHRTQHIKIFLTYSQSDPSADKVILGGRNIHDGFVFDHPSASFVYPTLVNYSSSGDEAWAHWLDFETLFTSKDLVETLMGQFFSWLHSDYGNMRIRDYTKIVETSKEIDPRYFDLKDNEIYLRSLVSVPFSDGHQLERTFIQMIDSAERTIKMSTPYFNLTRGLLAAFERAAARGVDVQLITRLDLKGDTADLVLSDVNKRAVNLLYKKIRIYEYTTAGKILHSKLFLIDNKFVMMGSVNLNLRSFFHDTENATLIYGPGFNRKMDLIYENYKEESKLLTQVQKTTFWKILLIDMIGTGF